MALVPTSSHGSSDFAGEVTVHVPNQTTPALALYNDTWDTDPTDPVLDIYAHDNGDAFIAAHNAGRTLQIGLSGQDIKVTNNGGLGFFGKAAVAQPAAPVTLGDVIAALKALGLVAT